MNIEKLRELVGEYLLSCEEYHSHLRTPREICYDGNYSSWQHWYGMYEREMRALLRALYLACDMIGVDAETLIAVEKAIRRQEKKRDWMWCADIRLPKHEKSYLNAIGQTERFRWLP